jgi:hypothetical protein
MGSVQVQLTVLDDVPAVLYLRPQMLSKDAIFKRIAVIVFAYVPKQIPKDVGRIREAIVP